MSTREESFRRLRAESWTSDGEFKKALVAASAKLQSLSDGSGDCVYDEYSILVSSMPSGKTPESFVLEMANDLNGTVNDGTFNTVNVFKRSKTGTPKVGEIIFIDIMGPDNGCVILAELKTDYFIFQTVETPKAGSHPENGSREFGFERTGGRIKFYTRGVSRPGNVAVRIAGAVPQMTGWTRLCRGLSDTLKAKGAAVVSDSFECYKQDREF